jgi:hypothetical protein
MQAAAAPPPVQQLHYSARPLPGTHPDSEAFAATLAARKLVHTCAAEEENRRSKQLQTRREKFGHARDIFCAILDGAWRQITYNEISSAAVLLCVYSMVQQVELRDATSTASRCVP